MATKKTSHKGKKWYLKYQAVGRILTNKLRRIRKHLKRNPNCKLTPNVLKNVEAGKFKMRNGKAYGAK